MMTSGDIAEKFNKRKSTVHRDIRSILKYNPVPYSEVLDNRGYTKYFELGEELCNALVSRYTKTSIEAGRLEYGALCAIEQLLDIKLIRQYKIGKYAVDGYDPLNNVVYEIDEAHHFTDSGCLRQEDVVRQQYIESELACTFKRIKVI